MTGWNDSKEALLKLEHKRLPHWENYLGFYSSWLGGYFREPWAMLLPLDDHGFHRGDAVFEAARIHDGAYFDLQSHLQRLQNSARAIGMELPQSLDEIQAICVQLAKLCGATTGALRLYVSRGPGGFSPNPKEVVGHQIYAAITKMKPPETSRYERGVSAMYSSVPAKDPFWSQIKSCNYLQNVLMKKESLEKGIDFAICVDSEGRLCEGATENMMMITQDGRMLVPKFDYTLPGTTMKVVMKLAQGLVSQGVLKSVEFSDIHQDDLREAKEAAFVGTTLAVLPMSVVDGHKIGSGHGGEISLMLNEALLAQMSGNSSLRTVF
jgi:branched-chain amino acid aminotransferase